RIADKEGLDLRDPGLERKGLMEIEEGRKGESEGDRADVERDESRTHEGAATIDWRLERLRRVLDVAESKGEKGRQPADDRAEDEDVLPARSARDLFGDARRDRVHDEVGGADDAERFGHARRRREIGSK